MYYFLWILMAIAIDSRSLEALLPPLYLTLAEFKALVDDKRLTDNLTSGEGIVSIQRLENGNLQVLTTKHEMIVDVVFEPTEKIGPGKFHLEFHEPKVLP